VPGQPGQAEDRPRDAGVLLAVAERFGQPRRVPQGPAGGRDRLSTIVGSAMGYEPEDLPWGPEAEPDQADAMVLQQESRRLGEALAQLPEKQRSLIERAYFGDLSHSEIAAETGLPLGTIKSRIRLALERLRHQMS
jgi:RNA polymerase sigma factor (sigma-70 family)